MSIREIIKMGHPTLRKEARPIKSDEVGTPEFRSLIEDMRETLHDAGGIGLAAPQIDESIQLAVIEITDPVTRYGEIPLIPFSVYINPSIYVLDPITKGYWEGCLSVPGLMGYVERPQHISVTYFDENFEKCSLEFQGFPATVFQHEYDHLKGILYVDKIDDKSLFAYEEEYREFHLGEEG